MLNGPFQLNEIVKTVKKLKQNKSSGGVLIANENIVSTIDTMQAAFVELFNVVSP